MRYGIMKDIAPPTTGEKLLAIVTYSHVPRILLALQSKNVASNREIAREVSIDESLCSKIMTLLLDTGIVRKATISGFPGQTRYWLTSLGDRCAWKIKGIVELAQFLPFKDDPCRGCANCVDVWGHNEIPDTEECTMEHLMTDEDIDLMEQCRCPYFELIDIKALQEQEAAYYQDWVDEMKEEADADGQN